MQNSYTIVIDLIFIHLVLLWMYLMCYLFFIFLEAIKAILVSRKPSHWRHVRLFSGEDHSDELLADYVSKWRLFLLIPIALLSISISVVGLIIWYAFVRRGPIEILLMECNRYYSYSAGLLFSIIFTFILISRFSNFDIRNFFTQCRYVVLFRYLTAFRYLKRTQRRSTEQ